MHMNKRILSLTLALVMILGTFTAVFAEVTTVEQKAAEFLRDNGVLEGDEKGDLLLDKKLERRDAVVLSARLLGEEEKAENTKFDEKFHHGQTLELTNSTYHSLLGQKLQVDLKVKAKESSNQELD